jgi:hypothetical protein
MFVVMIGGFPGVENSQAHLVIDYGMVTGELAGTTMPDEIAAGIANVRNNGAIEPNGSSHDGGGHGNPTGTGGASGLVNANVGGLHQDATSPQSCPPTPSASAKSQPWLRTRASVSAGT